MNTLLLTSPGTGFAAIQIWIFVLFLIYTSVNELNARLDDGALMKIFFTRRSSVMKSTPSAANSRAPRGSAGEPRYNHMKMNATICR
jgi:hypothetical protein